MTETLALDAGYRDGGLGLALMSLSAVASGKQGIQTLEFEHDTRVTAIAKLARRFGATQIGRRQCNGCQLSAPAAEVPSAITTRSAPPEATVPRAVQPHSQHTAGFAEIRSQLNLSLAVTTYQAGKLVLLRADAEQVNTHFHSFDRPMGLAADGDRLAIGTGLEIWEFHNAPAVAAKLSPAGKHDACFLPRGSHMTGDIDIHEMAWVGGGAEGRRLLRFRFTRSLARLIRLVIEARRRIAVVFLPFVVPQLREVITLRRRPLREFQRGGLELLQQLFAILFPLLAGGIFWRLGDLLIEQLLFDNLFLPKITSERVVVALREGQRMPRRQRLGEMLDQLVARQRFRLVLSHAGLLSRHQTRRDLRVVRVLPPRSPTHLPWPRSPIRCLGLPTTASIAQHVRSPPPSPTEPAALHPAT